MVELLVVITIIAILTTIGVVSYSRIMANTRDSKRATDLNIVQSALEQYHADQHYYPAAISFTDSFTNQTGNPITIPLASIITYLNEMPSDPLSTRLYNYAASPTGCTNSSGSICKSYCLYAKVENPTKNAKARADCPTLTIDETTTYDLEMGPP